MIKKLDKYIISSFVGPFVVTFFIALFVLVMQFFWLYMDELIGKGLSIWTILQLLAYMSTTLVPLALPLSILLASIMTFGNMGENFELVAIKASGISLLRYMRPLLLFIIGIGGLAFLFNNNVIPVANLKAFSLLYDARSSKPALSIRPGIFNTEINNYSIKIGSKDKDDRTIHDVLIYDQGSNMDNAVVTIAKKGEMTTADNKRYLIFKLEDGWRYEEGYTRGAHDYTQRRMHFAQIDKVFDLSALQFTRTSEDQFKNAYQMMNLSQLGDGIDSLKRYQKKVNKNTDAYIAPYVSITNEDTAVGKKLIKKIKADNHGLVKYDSSFLQAVPDSMRARVAQIASDNIHNFNGLLGMTAADKKIQNENFLKYEIEWHRKLSLSFACVLLFLIGAPFGAIIRKGGLGMPMVVAIFFFLVFHILSIVGEKMVKSGSVAPWFGMWLATGTLLPIALFFINQARKDSPLFNRESYVRFFKKVAKLFSKKSPEMKAVKS